MRRTLLFIPHEIAGIPVLGFGWLLLVLVAALVIRLAWARRRGQSIREVLSVEFIMWGVAAAAVVFVLPVTELHNVDGDPVGMAIRGYGVMLLAGVASGVALASYRAKSRGIDPEIVISMAPWAFVGGIVGARLFYVIQYRDKFIADSIGQTLRNMLAFTEGGLVVYGSFIGGFIALAIFIARHRLPLLKLGDVIVPAMFIGVFFGRIGCLMNGCCYGGRCEEGWTAIHFPAGSAVYQEQIQSGELLGVEVNPVSGTVRSIAADSPAERAGIPVGGKLEQIASDLSYLELAPRDIPEEEARTGVVATVGGERFRWSPDELPRRALPVFAAQLVSSVCSLALCVALCMLSSLRLRDGTIMLLGFASYAILRFVLEMIRVDEAGQFGTSLSISQWVSVIVLGISVVGLILLYRRSGGRALPAPAAPES